MIPTISRLTVIHAGSDGIESFLMALCNANPNTMSKTRMTTDTMPIIIQVNWFANDLLPIFRFFYTIIFTLKPNVVGSSIISFESSLTGSIKFWSIS